MRKVLPIVAVAGVALLSGCAHRGYGGQGPNEFAVARQAPLVVPPDFSLPAPKPGEVRPQDQSASQQALAAMFGGPAPRSAAEQATLDAAGDDSAQDGIRSQVGDPGTSVVDKGETLRDIEAAPAGDGQDASTSVPQ